MVPLLLPRKTELQVTIALTVHSTSCQLLSFLIQHPLYLSPCLFPREPGIFDDKAPLPTQN